MKKNKDFFERLEPAIRPNYRLFLSADLVGSTALKQRYSPFDAGEADDGALPGDAWYFFVSDFYSRFHNIFQTEVDRVLNADEEYCSKNKGEQPCRPRLSAGRIERWKLAGDEILYSIELFSFRELHCLLIAFSNALIFFRKVLYGDVEFLAQEAFASRGYHIKTSGRYEFSNLDVKGTAWTAGFPITNKEVILSSGFSEMETRLSSTSSTGRDLYLKQAWLEQENSARHPLVVDYVGPSVDTGFRLASFAQPRKLVISIEVAHLLSNNTGDRFDELNRSYLIKNDNFRISYDGRTPLKGVVGSRGYPIFWIDTGSDEGLSVIEDRLQDRSFSNWKDIRELCRAFFERNQRYIRAPIILDPEDQYNSQNPLCRSLSSCNKIWKSEKKRIRSRLDPYGRP